MAMLFLALSFGLDTRASVETETFRRAQKHSGMAAGECPITRSAPCPITLLLFYLPNPLRFFCNSTQWPLPRGLFFNIFHLASRVLYILALVKTEDYQ